jgi:hypothetical protein
MDLDNFIRFYKDAPSIVRDYEERRKLIEQQVDGLKLMETDEEREMLHSWIHNNTDWCLHNVESYNRAKAIMQIPHESIEEIFTLYKGIYGE